MKSWAALHVTPLPGPVEVATAGNFLSSLAPFDFFALAPLGLPRAQETNPTPKSPTEEEERVSNSDGGRLGHENSFKSWSQTLESLLLDGGWEGIGFRVRVQRSSLLASCSEPSCSFSFTPHEIFQHHVTSWAQNASATATGVLLLPPQPPALTSDSGMFQ